ncbi:MAG: AbrB/MazE/SpoVT family DNA-binding domain-containing protein [Coriobacteriales bacterium]|nr:AbrB/MazE/SpoVT family DNA-binding domain-containing protein [Coriobacteriales bacterium]
MSTPIAQWGNSCAVRLPKEKLRLVGLKQGDLIEVEVNQSGHLEIVPRSKAHRRTIPSRLVTFEELFKGYEGGRLDNRDAWPNDDLMGKELDAWSG